jgi:hypothetical protein
MTSAVSRGVDLVTVLIGGADICLASNEAEMTSVQSFHDAFATALNTFAAGLPDSRVVVLSVPNVYRTWEVLKDNASARAAWNTPPFFCKVMFENPLSTAQADVDRRARVLQRIVDYNTALADVCALYTGCSFDDNTLFNIDLVEADFSTVDYVHPSTQWHTKVASAVWPFVAGPTPTVAITPTSGPKKTAVTLNATVFGAGEQVKFKYKTGIASPAAVTLCTGLTDANGTASCNGVIPAGGSQGAKGAHSVVAKGVTSLTKAKTTFTLT